MIMNYKLKIIIPITLFILLLCAANMTYAQDISPVAQLSQDYILRLNEELRDSNDAVPTSPQAPIIISPEIIEKDALIESIDTITKTLREIEVEKQNTIINIKENINKIITPINLTDEEKNELFTSISDDITSIGFIDTESEIKKIEDLQFEIEQFFIKIKEDFKQENVDSSEFEQSQEHIKVSLDFLKSFFIDKKNIIESRQGEFVFKDTDKDNLSDYEEMYIYRTDPNNSRTKGDTKIDGEKIQMGINPLSDTEEKIQYEDPREDRGSFVSEFYKVERIELLKDEKKLVIEGSALANTYIVLYLYSTSVIVPIKTNNTGEWRYELDTELENGEHQLYIATVDSTGNIIIRSSPILFTKTSGSVIIGIMGTTNHLLANQNFVKDNFIILILAIIICTGVLSTMIVYKHKTIISAINELKNQVNSK